MPTEVIKVAEEELQFLGDIFCSGMIKKGLSKIGKNVDSATPQDMKKALDMHIGPALVSFVGPSESQKIVTKIKMRLDKVQSIKGAAS